MMSIRFYTVNQLIKIRYKITIKYKPDFAKPRLLIGDSLRLLPQLLCLPALVNFDLQI